MKKLIFLFATLFSLTGFSQLSTPHYQLFEEESDTTFHLWWNDDLGGHEIFDLQRDGYMHWKSTEFKIDGLSSVHTFNIQPSIFVTANTNGMLQRVSTSNLFLDIANINHLQDSLTNKYTKSQSNNLFEPKFSKLTAFNKNFGTVSSTIAEGNDSRINNGQTAFGWGNHASAGYVVANGTSSQVMRGDGSKTSYSAGTIYYHNGSVVTQPQQYTGTSTVSTGTAVFYLTTNGSAGGTAQFANVNYFKAEVNDSNANYNYAYSLSGDKKTMTITVTKVTAAVLGLLQFSTAPNGVTVYLNCVGN